MSAGRRSDIRDPEQLQALASAARQEIVDTVHALGACSVNEIARELGRPADGIYHHVRVLLDAGLLLEAGERPTSRRAEALVKTPSRGVLRLRYEPRNPDNVEAVGKIVASMLRVTERDFRAGFRPGLARCTGARRNLNACRQKAWLSKDELLEVNQLLGRLQEIFSNTRCSDDGQLHGLTFVLAPIESAGPRRD